MKTPQNPESRSWPILVLALVLVILPLLVLAGFGLRAVWAGNQWLWLAGWILMLSLPLLGALWWLQRKPATAPATPALQGGEALVGPAADWGPREVEMFERLKQEVDAALERSDDWAMLPEHGWQLMGATARLYDKHEWGFSVPELLAMSEEVSRRYRYLLLDHVPGIEQVSCAVIRGGVVHRDRLGRLGKVGGWIWDGWRVVRAATPAGWLSELRGQLLSNVLGNVNERLQWRLKQALLLDVAAVAIDLYSGRFRLQDERQSDAASLSLQLAAAPQPLRVVVVGQISAGKSSLVNALVGEVVAESHVLPSTRDVLGYEWALDETVTLQLVDLPGLTADPAQQQRLLEEVTRAHILLWVVRANQPARDADSAFRRRLDDWYGRPEHLGLKRPRLIMVMSQADRLFARGQWQLPLTAEQEARMGQALAFNESLLQPDVIVPLALTDQSWNIEALEIELHQSVCDGIQTQLNQRRLLGQTVSMGQQLQRVMNAAGGLFRLLRQRDGG